MRKRISHISLCLLLLVQGWTAQAQNPTLTINSSNIGNEVSTELVTFTSSCLLQLGLLNYATIEVKGMGNLSGGATLPTIPLGKVGTKITQIDGTGVSLVLGGNSATERFLSTSYQAILSSAQLLALNLLTSGSVTLKYRIPQTEMMNFAWVAGTYLTTLSFDIRVRTLLLLELCSSTPTRTLTIQVTPFISITAPPSNITLAVNDFKYFRNTSISQNHTFSVQSTVRPRMSLKTNNANFNYTPSAHNTGIVLNPSVSHVNASMTGGNAFALSSSAQNLFNYALTIPNGNTFTKTNTFSISPAALKANFIRAGSYATTLNYSFSDTTNQTATQTALSTLNVNVDEMYEISVNQNDVYLRFDNAAKYQQGTDTTLNNHLTMSATVPYNVTVSSASTQLNNGSGQSVNSNFVTIGPAAGQAGITPVSNLGTAAQTLIANASPEIDRSVNLKYAVSATNAQQLVGKTAGDYTTTLTYTIVAQ